MVNSSQVKEKRFWDKWKANGAVGTVKKESISDRVNQLFEQYHDIKAIKIAQLSDCAIAVYDDQNEWDVYFDAKSYKPTNPRIWKCPNGESALYSAPRLIVARLGVLSGIARIPRIQGFDDALEFAREQLLPVSYDKAYWYNDPVILK